MSNKNQDVVPLLRFPQFSGTWHSSKLKKLAADGFTNGVFNDPSKVGSGYRLVNVKDMYVGDKIILENLTLLDLSKKEFQKNRVRFGDIFFTRSSLVKEGIAWSNVMLDDVDDVTFDGHLIKMSLDTEKLNPYFFSKALRTSTLRRQIVARGKTGTMTTIGQNDMASVIAYYPELPEQEKIAKFFGSVDAKLNALRRKRALLAEYKRGVMQKLFTQQIRFTQDDGRPFPPWEDTKLGDISKILRGSGLSKSSLSVDGKHECILYGELFRTYNEVIQKVISRTNDEEGLVSKAGDILMPTSDVTPDGLATASVLMRSNVKLGGDMNIIRLKSKINPVFMSYFLNTLKKEIMRLVTGTTIKHIYAKDIKGLRLSIPSEPKEQQKIADFLTAIDAKITAVDQQITHMETFKKGLLQQMFV